MKLQEVSSNMAMKIIEKMTSGPRKYGRAVKRAQVMKSVETTHFEHEIGKCELDT